MVSTHNMLWNVTFFIFSHSNFTRRKWIRILWVELFFFFLFFFFISLALTYIQTAYKKSYLRNTYRHANNHYFKKCSFWTKYSFQISYQSSPYQPRFPTPGSLSFPRIPTFSSLYRNGSIFADKNKRIFCLTRKSFLLPAFMNWIRTIARLKTQYFPPFLGLKNLT